MKKIKVAVIGTGNISNSHIPAYLKNENVELYALCDINEEVLRKAGELRRSKSIMSRMKNTTNAISA